MNFNDFDESLIYEAIKNEITGKVRLERNNRIYVIIRSEDDQMKGKFLFGGRKRSPREGFAMEGSEGEDLG